MWHARRVEDDVPRRHSHDLARNPDAQRSAQENQDFKFKFNSLLELKKAIRSIKLLKHKDAQMDNGNRGYLIKNGQPTAKVKIEVVPVQANE